VLALPAAAWAGGDQRVSPQRSSSDAGDAGLAGGICATPDARPSAKTVSSSSVSRLIYLNRCADGGCRIRRGEHDALANTSSLPTRTNSRLTAFEHGDEIWRQVVDCVAEIYLPYDVTITDVDPSPLAHHEAIVAGTGDEIGLDAGLGGIAPAVCAAQDNLISFTFANFYDANVREICEVVAHESAHAFGLDHVLGCSDPLSYLPECGARFFRDEELPCGEFEERECACGGTTQNPHRMLLAVLGEGRATPAPRPEILIPVPGADVAPGFAIYVRAGVTRGLGAVDLWVNGTRLDTRSGQRNNDVYIFETSEYEIADGILDIEIRAVDDLGSEGRADVTVTRGQPCAEAAQCLDGQSCEAGRCRFPQPTGTLGDLCESDSECESQLCLDNGLEKRCSASCLPEREAPCGSGENGPLQCLEAGSGGFCWPAPVDDQGGCRVFGPSRPTGLIGFGLLGALVLLRRRQRRGPLA